MMKLKTAVVVCGGALALAWTAPALADEALQRCLARRAEQDHFSGVIWVSEGARSLAFLARGTLARPDSAPVTADTRFNLGSASKMFTAVAVGQLIDAGKVQLDDPIGKFVSGLTPEAAHVTVRQLLTHSSGLGDFFKPQNMAAMIKARTASDILPLIANDKPSFPPGSKFAYSNSGFALLGVLIERVSGQSYGGYLAAHVFAPAGMTETGLDPKPLSTLAVGMTAMGSGMAPGEAQQKPGLVMIGPDGRQPSPGAGPLPNGPPGPITEELALHPAPGATEGYGSPAGGLFSTAGDMQRFAAAFLDHRLTSAATATALTSPQIVALPAHGEQPKRDYGLGFGVGTDGGETWFGHNGGTLGANTEFVVFPKRRLTLTVLSNRDPPMASRLFAYARRLVLDPSLLPTCGAIADL